MSTLIPEWETPAPSRRTFIRTTTATAAGALLGGLPAGWVGGVYADDSPETKTMRFGIIALTDCAPIVLAHELLVDLHAHRLQLADVACELARVDPWHPLAERAELADQLPHLLRAA